MCVHAFEVSGSNQDDVPIETKRRGYGKMDENTIVAPVNAHHLVIAWQ